MDAIVAEQTELYGRITRTLDNLKKSGAAKITSSLVATTMRLLDSKWERFESQHRKMRAEHWEEMRKHDYHLKDFWERTEAAYAQQRAALLDLEETLKPAKEITKSSSSDGASSPRTTLPRIQLPQFSGRYEDWPPFRDLFMSLIGNDPVISDVTRLHYLKTSLKGEAELLIKNLPTTNENFERAWTTLTEYYENTRLLVRSYYSTFTALPKMKTESAVELRKMMHCMSSTVGALEGIGRPITSSEDLFVFLAVELLDPRSRREWEGVIGDTTEPPSYSEFKQFVERRLHTLEAMQPNKPSELAKSGSSKTARAHHTQKEAKRERERCTLCKKDHFIVWCDVFKKKPAEDRKSFVTGNDLCINCLGKHKTGECQSKRSCTVCGERHHSTLHDAYRSPSNESKPNSIETAKTSHVARPCLKERVAVLLATARVSVRDRNGELQPARALIDQGSEISIVTEAFAQKLRLTRTKTPVAVFGVGGQQTGIARGKVTMNIFARNGGRKITVSAIILPRLTLYTGVSSIAVREWQHLEGVDLADPEFTSGDSIDILLGADVFDEIIRPGLRRGGAGEPIAQETSLGWIVSGKVSITASQQTAMSLQCSIDEPLSALVRRFWEQEEVLSAGETLTAEERRCEDLFIRTHTRTSEGRYMVRLPVEPSLPDLSASRIAAVRMLFHMERRFERDRDLKRKYSEFMREYEDMGHMSRVSADEDQEKEQANYLPHHGVWKDVGVSAKLRVVFNASVSINGQSLNDHVQDGQNLLPPLADVLLRWRQHRYAYTADVEKMYRQILVHPDDRKWQRIVWRHSPHDHIEHFALNTVTYGMACAPYLAIRTLRQLANDEERRFPLGAAVLRRDVYVDDVLSGAATLEEAQKVSKQLRELCTAGGFPLKKWAANDVRVIEDVRAEDLSQPGAREWLPHQTHTALGLHWHPSSDEFSFSAWVIKMGSITKRTVLSQASRLFDPIGWLSPVVVVAKILIQTAWAQGIGWDTPLAPRDADRWNAFFQELAEVASIRVPRWVGYLPGQEAELHGFADASERAFAAAVYLRTRTKENCWETRLLTARTKVAPLKQISLPRLELCAATLLSKLTAQVQTTLNWKSLPVILWSDSTVTLSWIRGHPTRWTTFVANRVSGIQTMLPEAHWRHIRSGDNPADCASRGLTVLELAHHSLWWRGPQWLADGSGPLRTPINVEEQEDLPEVRSKTHLVHHDREEPNLLTRYSSLRRLVRVTAWCRRWLPTTRRDAETSQGPVDRLTLSTDEVDEALMAWIRVIQALKYPDEIAAVQEGRAPARKSPLVKLTPTLDEQGVLRVGGRLKLAALAYDERHPIIIPRDTTLTKLIVESCHARVLHGGVQQTLAMVRQRFWIPGGRAAVKACIHRCIRCLRWRAATPQPAMGALPKPRVTPSRPFLHTGVDYAGPIRLRIAKGRGTKAYKAFIAVFVCLSTRAVHLEVASDYTADAFLAALKRFTSRRGLPEVMYSDCGTNFAGAEAELRALFTASNTESRRIGSALAEERIRWRFNPPSAPHFGGLWEAAVKSLKHHVRRVLGDTILTFEEMTTFLTGVEACLNSRPLCAMSDDPGDLAILTPGHFLIGSALLAIPEPGLNDVPRNRLSRWQLVQQMREHFWRRWSQEYLHSLAETPKWWKQTPAPAVGQLCLVRNEITSPAKWPLARIIALHPGEDGQVRVVTLKTATSKLTRPVVKIILLPIESREETRLEMNDK